MAVRFSGLRDGVVRGIIIRKGEVGLPTDPEEPEVPTNPLAWITPQGSLGAYEERTSVTIYLEVVDPYDRVNSFSIISGGLPDGLEMNPYTGIITGTISSVPQDHTFTFTVLVRDELGDELTGTFSISVINVPQVQWITPAGLIGEVGLGSDFEAQLVAEA
jgi:Putative Ig domain.